jgi:hypothetical protein
VPCPSKTPNKHVLVLFAEAHRVMSTSQSKSRTCSVINNAVSLHSDMIAKTSTLCARSLSEPAVDGRLPSKEQPDCAFRGECDMHARTVPEGSSTGERDHLIGDTLLLRGAKPPGRSQGHVVRVRPFRNANCKRYGM